MLQSFFSHPTEALRVGLVHFYEADEWIHSQVIHALREEALEDAMRRMTGRCQIQQDPRDSEERRDPLNCICGHAEIALCVEIRLYREGRGGRFSILVLFQVGLQVLSLSPVRLPMGTCFAELTHTSLRYMRDSFQARTCQCLPK